MFQTYWNSTIRDSIRTQAEEDMVRAILSIKTLRELRDARKAHAAQCRNPVFAASHEKLVAEKALTVAGAEIEAMMDGMLREAITMQTQPQHMPVQEACCSEPPHRSILGSIFHGIMSDYYAYQHIDPNSKELPSQQYLREKAVGSVLWDVLLGRR